MRTRRAYCFACFEGEDLGTGGCRKRSSFTENVYSLSKVGLLSSTGSERRDTNGRDLLRVRRCRGVLLQRWWVLAFMFALGWDVEIRERHYDSFYYPDSFCSTTGLFESALGLLLDSRFDCGLRLTCDSVLGSLGSSALVLARSDDG